MDSAFCKLPTPYESPLLALPSEILLIIARFVVDFDSVDGECYEVAFMKRSRYSCLLSLSCVHRILRRVCLTAGLFRHICPKSMNFKAFGTFKEFHTRQQLVSLSVDLGNSKVWTICAQLMEQFPDLDELRLLGSPARSVSLFRGSHLSHRFSLFKGSSLVLRSACFTNHSLPILRQIGHETVTSLYFDESKLHFRYPYSDDDHLRLPMFPNLKKVKFIVVPVTSDQCRVNTFESFVDVFLIGCQLTHFEISYGFGPFCSVKQVSDSLIHVRLERMVKTNASYIRSQQKLLLALRQNSYASLKVYIDHDPLGETFVADDGTFQRHEDIPLSPFRNMKLLVFRVNDITMMCQEYPPNDDDCDSTLALPNLRKQLLAQHHHSMWRHVCSP